MMFVTNYMVKRCNFCTRTWMLVLPDDRLLWGGIAELLRDDFDKHLSFHVNQMCAAIYEEN